MRKTDAAVIGFGKSGKTLAGALAAAGRSVVMIEKSDKMYGGTCINVGCIPTKSLFHSAALSAAAGGTFSEKAVRYEKAIAEKNRVTSMLRGKNYHKLADDPAVTVLNGTATFTDGHHLAVELAAGGSEEIEAEQIFINTGSSAVLPKIDGLTESRYFYLSETLMENTVLPHHLVIIGGGYIGMEFASMFANFGSDVTVIQNGEVFLPREDAEIAAAVLASLEKRGVRVIRSAETQNVRDDANEAVISVKTADGVEELRADAILTATGRRPNSDGMGLEAAGVEVNKRGGIVTDKHLRTTAHNIWAMGDITGGQMFTYMSLDDYRIVKSQIIGGLERTTENRGAVPYCVFLDPPFARVGLTEREALDKGLNIKVGRLPAAAIPKAHVVQKPEGLLKAIVDDDTGLIVGAHLFCEESHEMINILKLAIDAKLPYTTLRDCIFTHPTMSEALNDLFAAVK